jgi:uncharacterized protein
MSRENMEAVRRVFDAVNDRDIEAMQALFSEDGEFHSVLAASEGRVFRGHQGIRDYFEWFDDAFEEFRNEVEEVIEADENRVVALARFIARGRESGVVLDQPIGAVFSLLGGQVTRMESYFDRAEALRTAGLGE